MVCAVAMWGTVRVSRVGPVYTGLQVRSRRLTVLYRSGFIILQMGACNCPDN